MHTVSCSELNMHVRRQEAGQRRSTRHPTQRSKAPIPQAPRPLGNRTPSPRGEKGVRGVAAVGSPRGRLPFSRGAPLSHLSAHSWLIAIHTCGGRVGVRRGVGGPRRSGLPGADCPSPQVPPPDFIRRQELWPLPLLDVDI